MSEQRPAKQARINLAGDSHITAAENAAPPAFDVNKMQELLQNLDRQNLSNILLQAAEAHPDVEKMVSSAVKQIHEQESQRVLNFDSFSKVVWRELNVTHDHLSGSKEYDITFEVEETITGCIDKIVKQCGRYANPDTCWNGLSTLRKIGKSIVLSNGLIGHEVHKRFQWDTCLTDGMLQIIAGMEDWERDDIRNDVDNPESLWPKLLELQEISKDYCLFDDLADVISAFENDRKMMRTMRATKKKGMERNSMMLRMLKGLINHEEK